MPELNKYEFWTEWTVDGTLEQVCSIIRDVESYSEWWQPVYISTVIVEKGDARGEGRIVQLTTRGWLPYVLRWRLLVTEVAEPHSFAFTSSGDLEGEGSWTLRQVGAQVKLQLDWRVRARKSVLQMLSFVFRPLFVRNHEWAMARGQIGLANEMRRRFKQSDGSAGAA